MDNSSQWPQGFGVVKAAVDYHHPSSSSAGSIDQQHQQKRTTTLAARPQKDQIVNCPRCNSVNTKFCYYNNYSLSQPRYFCKTCRRYWTAGGSLRNVPVGGGSRKNRRSSSATSNSLTAAAQQQAQAAAVAINLSSSSISLHQAHQADLNLSFPPPHLKPPPHDDRHHHPNNMPIKPSFNIDHQLSSTSKLLFPHLPNPNNITSITPLLPPMGLFKNSNESRDQMMRSIMMSGSSQHHTSSTASIFSFSAGFPQMHQDQFKPSSINFSLDGFSSGDASSLQLGVQQNNSDGARLLFPFNQDNQNLNKDQQQVSTGAALLASSDNNVQFDLPNPRSSSVQGGGGGADHGFWTGMLSGSGSW